MKAITPTAVIARTSLIVGSDGTSSHERHIHALASGRSSGMSDTDDMLARARQRSRGRCIGTRLLHARRNSTRWRRRRGLPATTWAC